MTQNVHFAKYFVKVHDDGERFLALVLFQVSTYALFYPAQSNQLQKETNVPYSTPNQTKLAIFTKHSNGNINTSCCGCQGSSPKTRTGVVGHLPDQDLDGSSSSFKTIVSPVIGIKGTILWGGYVHPTGM